MADILSQEEIEALLDIDEDEYSEQSYDKQVTLYDFKRPQLVSREQLRSLRGIHDKMARRLSEDLSKLVGEEVEIQLHCADSLTYGEFLMSLPNPTTFNVYNSKGLHSDYVIETNNSIMLPFIDTILKRENTDDVYREFTSTENGISTLYDSIVNEVINESWKEICEFGSTLKSKESSPNVVQIVAQNEIVVLIVMEIIIGHSSGMMNICYPVEMLNQKVNNSTILDLLTEMNNPSLPIGDKITDDVIEDIMLPIKVRFGTREMLLEDVKDLGINSTFDLDAFINDPVDVIINDIIIAKGEIVIIDGNYGVQLREVFESGIKDIHGQS